VVAVVAVVDVEVGGGPLVEVGSLERPVGVEVLLEVAGLLLHPAMVTAAAAAPARPA
jgi:hypothetical protein